MKRVIILSGLAFCMTLGSPAAVQAADYTFTTTSDVDYYQSTNYEDEYNAQYNYGGKNQIQYDIPEIQYGLAQDFLERSLNNPYLSSQMQYGIGSGAGGSSLTAAVTGSAESGNDPETEHTVSIHYTKEPEYLPYVPAVTVSQLMQSDGSIGTVSISRVNLKAGIYEGTGDDAMKKGAGHYSGSSLWNGNVGLFGHNRGDYAHFSNLRKVEVGDTVTYTTSLGTRTYHVDFVGTISSTDYSYLNETGDNRITLITCIADQPSLRLCVQASEI